MTMRPSTPVANSGQQREHTRTEKELTGKCPHGVARRFVGPDHCNGVLMDRLQLRVVLGLALQIHLPEHVQSRFLALVAKTRAPLDLHGAAQLPAVDAARKAESLAVVTGGNDLGLAVPD